MDINKYAVFVDVADTLNFTKSGEKLGYTQSGISRVLKTLETEMGFPLFTRSKQGVVLTKNAEILLPKIRRLLELNDEIEEAIDAINGIESGHITIACFASISRLWLPRIIYSFKSRYPKIEIELLEGGTDDIVRWVSDNTADFGLLSHHKTHQLKWIHLYDDPLVAVLPEDYELNGRTAFPVSEFARHPFIISAQGVDYDVHYTLSEEHVTPDIRYSSKDDSVIISMVANHLGLSLLADLIVDGKRDGIITLPIEPAYNRDLGIVLPPDSEPSPAAAKMIAEIRSYAEGLTSPGAKTAAVSDRHGAASQDTAG